MPNFFNLMTLIYLVAFIFCLGLLYRAADEHLPGLDLPYSKQIIDMQDSIINNIEKIFEKFDVDIDKYQEELDNKISQ